MKLKKLSSFIRGLFDQEGTESRIPDQSLLKIKNMDIDITGRLTRRTGYSHWADLGVDNITAGSIPSSDDRPNTLNPSEDFQAKVQGLYSFVDVAGVEYIFAVANGNVYAEVYENKQKTWLLLNKASVGLLQERMKEIKMVSYFDTVFINDLENNVYMFNAQQYSTGGWLISGNRFIYFAGDTIYIRSYEDFSSTAEDIVIEDDETNNIPGTAVYDSLVSGISFLGTETGIATTSDLNFGYTVRAGNKSTGYNYYVLSNGKNEVGTDKCYLIKFNENLAAQDYVAINLNATGNPEILSFDYYNGDLYLWCKDGQIEVLDVDSFANVPLTDGDVSSMVAPSNGSNKQYSLTVNDKGIFIYTTTLPSKTDWWQPKVFGNLNFNTESKEDFTYSSFADEPTVVTPDIKIGKDLTDDTDIQITNNFFEDIVDTKHRYDLWYSHWWVGYNRHRMERNGSVSVNKYVWHMDANQRFVNTTGPGEINGGYITNNATVNPEAKSSWLYDVEDDVAAMAVTAKVWDGNAFDNKYNGGVDEDDDYIITNRVYNRANYITQKNTIKKMNIIDFYSEVELTPEDNRDIVEYEDIVVGGDISPLQEYKKSGYDADLNMDFSEKSVIRLYEDSTLTDTEINVGIEKNAPFTVSRTSSESLELDVPNKTQKEITHSPYFAYDEQGNIPSNVVVWTSYDGKDLTKNTSEIDFYYLYNELYDSMVFSSKTASNHVLMVGLDTSGNLLEETLNGVPQDDEDDGFRTWRWVLPLGKTAVYKNLLPLQNLGDKIFFGTSMDTYGDTNNGYHISLDVINFEIDAIKLAKSERQDQIQGDYTERFFIQNNAGDNPTKTFLVGNTWDIENAVNRYEDYTNLMVYNSNLFLHVLKQVLDDDDDELNRIKPLGVPTAPIVTIEDDATSTFVEDWMYRYHTAYKFYDGETTDLSQPSTSITIPSQTVKAVISNLNLLNELGVSLYDKDDIDEIQLYRSGRQVYDVIRDVEWIGSEYGENYMWVKGYHPDGTDMFLFNQLELGDNLVVTGSTHGNDGTYTVLPTADPIDSIDIATKTITLSAGYQVSDYAPMGLSSQVSERVIEIYGSTGGTNDGFYTVRSINLSARSMVVRESLPDDGLANLGTVRAPRILPNIQFAGVSDTGNGMYKIWLNEVVPSSDTFPTPTSSVAISDLREGDANFTAPILVAALEKDSNDDWYYDPDGLKPYAEGEFEDNVKDRDYGPFTRTSVKMYPCKDFLIHKNRLILINKTNEQNSNIIQYSDVDLAEAVPPTNIRAIESGDGDTLYGGISVQDYLFLFKEYKIYSILGDAATGQLVDIAENIGTKYKRTIVEYNKDIFFMNRTGIFIIRNTQVSEISPGALEDLFNEREIDSIDFDNCEVNAFAYVDKKHQEIHFHVPKKDADGNSSPENNYVIILNITIGNFRTYEYSNNFFLKHEARDVSNNDKVELMGTYDGLIYQLANVNSDNDQPIEYEINTKAFNINNELVRKNFKFLKVFGTNLSNIELNFDIDGTENLATITFRDVGGDEEALATIHNSGIANRIIVKVTGGTEIEEPASIDEILLGFETLRGSIR